MGADGGGGFGEAEGLVSRRHRFQVAAVDHPTGVGELQLDQLTLHHLGQLGQTEQAQAAMARALKANPALTPQHLADQIRILAGGSQDQADKSLAGLKAAGLL